MKEIHPNERPRNAGLVPIQPPQRRLTAAGVTARPEQSGRYCEMKVVALILFIFSL
jgi:hypothetical protein